MLPIVMTVAMAGTPDTNDAKDINNFWFDEQTIYNNLHWCEHHVIWVRNMQMWADSPKWLQEQEEEAQFALQAWAMLWQAKSNDDEIFRKDALSCLRDLIGYEMYYRGMMPNPVPLRFFK